MRVEETMVMRKIMLFRLSLALSVVLLSGCTAMPKRLTSDDIDRFIAEYQKQSTQVEKRRQEEKSRGIRSLEVENPQAPVGERRVSASLVKADLQTIIERLKFDYVLSGISRLSGRVTASFSNLALPQALQAILAPAQLQATFDGQVATISPLPQVDLKLDSKNDYVMRKRVLKYADTRTLEPILASLLLEPSSDSEDDSDSSDDSYDTSFDSGGSNGSGGSATPEKSLTFAALNAENAILLKGPSAEVNNALKVLDAVDSDSGHIMLEAMVVTFSATDLLQVGTRISNGASGNLSDISIDWANLAGATISFTSIAGAANTRAFQAALSLLLQNDEARVLARPYLAAIPGYQAKLDVAEDRYVTTFTQNTGEVTLQPVTAGITMTMTPFLLPEDEIRMDIQISVSQFTPTLNNVALARSRSDAVSTMRVHSGEPIVIGGLMAAQTSDSKAGVPGARSIPGLGLLFGTRKNSNAERRVLIYITPYIWEPGMSTPGGLEDETLQFMREQAKGNKP